MTVSLNSVNPEYEYLYDRVSSALRHMSDIPEGVRGFTPDAHELSVLQALEWLLTDSYEQFCSYTLLNGVNKGLVPVDEVTFSRYAAQVTGSEQILRWALLLHDVAKGRGSSGPHPENCASITANVLSNLGDLDKAQRDLVTWLVKYHDVLGNIYSGERSPIFLLDITCGCTQHDRDQRLRLLQAVMLCDIRGTQGGVYLTKQKAQFWLELSSEGQIREHQDKLLTWRAERWTGDLAGGTDRQAADTLLSKILPKEDQDLSRMVTMAFGSRISYIVYGYYLFTALTTEQLATLMRIVAHAADCLNREQLTLEFGTIYKPTASDADAALCHYVDQLDQEKLRLAADFTLEMVVEKPRVTKGDTLYCP